MPATSSSTSIETVDVVTSLGPIRGATVDGVTSFRGVPYAATTAGENRFRPPQPREPWTEVRDATVDGPASIQAEFPEVLAYLVEAPHSEDSLSINVWTPSTGAENLPIMVFFHGGAYIMGANSVPLYDGTEWARRGVVAVTVNYRLAALGYLFLDELFDDLEETGVLGTLDAAAALEFIAANARAFGGDPSSITIMGSSAGGGQVCTLLGMPRAQPLIRRAFPMSIGEGDDRFAEDPTATARASATRTARAFLDILGVEPGDTAALRALPASAFVVGAEMYIALAQRGVSGFLGPVPGSPEYPKPYRDAIADGETAHIDLLVGVAGDEQGGRHSETAGAREAWDLRFGMQRPSSTDEVELLDLYPHLGPEDEAAIIADYTSWLTAAGRPAAWEDVYMSSLGDRVMVAATMSRGLLQAGHAPTRMLLFAWPSPQHGGAGGAAHGLATPLLFHNLDLPAWQAALGDPHPQQLADALFDALVAFVRTGDPNAAGLPAWPLFDAADRATMVFDSTISVQNDPLGARLRHHRL